MYITRKKRGEQAPSLGLAAAAATAATTLLLLARRGHAFHPNMLLVRRASTTRAPSRQWLTRRVAGALASTRTATATTSAPISALSSALSMMAWEERAPPDGRRNVDRGFSTGGVVDKSFRDGDRSDYPSRSSRDAGSGRGGRGSRQPSFADDRGGRTGGKDVGRYRSGGDGGGGGRYEQRGRGGGSSRDWDQASDNRVGGRGERGGRGGYDRDFGHRRSSSWEERGKGGGGRRDGGRGRVVGGRRGSGRGVGRGEGVSRAWTPESGGGNSGGSDQAWGGGSGGRGAARVERYVDEDDERTGSEEEFGQEGAERTQGSGTASNWMRGELCESFSVTLLCFCCGVKIKYRRAVLRCCCIPSPRCSSCLLGCEGERSGRADQVPRQVASASRHEACAAIAVRLHGLHTLQLILLACVGLSPVDS